MGRNPGEADGVSGQRRAWCAGTSTVTSAADFGRFARAVLDRDDGALHDLFQADPTVTLLWLDRAMRGLLFPASPWEFRSRLDEIPHLRAWVAWLVEEDRRLRGLLGEARRDVDLADLRGAYRAGDLVLAVGAGISAAAGMPDWNSLVVELIDDALHHGTPEHRTELLDHAARSGKGPYTRTVEGHGFMGDASKFAAFLDSHLREAPSEVRDRLHRARRSLLAGGTGRAAALREAGEAVRETFGDQIFDHVRRALFNRRLQRTSVHPAVARMVRPIEAPPSPTPRVFAIVTYNFDDLLERAIHEAGRGFTVYVSRAGEAGIIGFGRPFVEGDRPSAVDIYHVHGFTPDPQGPFAFVPVADIDLVLCETQFRSQYGDDSSFTVRVQHGVLGSTACLFIGSSLEDEDSVSLMEALHRRHPGWFNYAVLRLPENQQQITSEELDRLNQRYHTIGVRVIWISDWGDIPELLDTIREPPPAHSDLVERLRFARRLPLPSPPSTS